MVNLGHQKHFPSCSPRCETRHAAWLSHYRRRRVVRGQLIRKSGLKWLFKVPPGACCARGCSRSLGLKPQVTTQTFGTEESGCLRSCGRMLAPPSGGLSRGDFCNCQHAAIAPHHVKIRPILVAPGSLMTLIVPCAKGIATIASNGRVCLSHLHFSAGLSLCRVSVCFGCCGVPFQPI